MISIIVPIYNEEKNIRDFIYNLYCLENIKEHEVLFIDGGSSDKTKEILEELKYFGYSYYTSPKKGRANQMNYGVEISHGDILWFVHADSVLKKDVIKKVLACPTEVGCLKIKFHPNSLSMRINSIVSNARAGITNIAFGDQGLFLTRRAFEKVGGYKDMPIMEDYQISQDLTALDYKITVIPSTITTSTRRYKGHTYKTMWQMQKLQKMHLRGVSAEKIAKMYRDVR